ncbi:hypothetical protein PspLS_04622 [Pyricularia sp. CBS 133598]|nr:hypothetical protein PspLS_04622 [Pyricularia sp. CBS 133598]
MDLDTLAMVVQLQLEDLNALKAQSKEKGRETDAPSDIEIATELLRAELAAQAKLISDKALSKQIQPDLESTKNLDDELIDKLKLLYVTDHEEQQCCEDLELPHAESSSWAASRQMVTSTADESLFPLRWCKQLIPLERNRIFLDSELVGRFSAKKIQLETPNRIYCRDPGCSNFVPPLFIDTAENIATCVCWPTKNAGSAATTANGLSS